MAATKEQMNVQIASTLKALAKTCAAAHQTSLNAWIANAIEEQIAKDKENFQLDEMNKALTKVAKKFLPGKVATHAQMLAMASRVAAQDTEEGFAVDQLAESSPTPK